MIKRDSGRRFLDEGVVFFTATCEDGSMEQFGFGWQRDMRLNETGAFHFALKTDPGDVSTFFFEIDGTAERRNAEGTFEYRYPSFDEAGDAQLCTTGTVEWTATRRHSVTVAPIAVPSNMTMLSIGRDGDLRVIEP